MLNGLKSTRAAQQVGRGLTSPLLSRMPSLKEIGYTPSERRLG